MDGDAEHIDRYDRQIRAWGIQTQQKLRSTKFLLIGMNGTSLEVAKNLILAGANSVTFTKPDDSSTYFEFLRGLNPQCDVKITDTLDASDVILSFNQSPGDTSSILEQFSQSIPVLIVTNSQADLIFKSTPPSNRDTPPAIDALHESIFGALIAETVIRWLPPLESPIVLQLNYDPVTMKAGVDKLM